MDNLYENIVTNERERFNRNFNRRFYPKVLFIILTAVFSIIIIITNLPSITNIVLSVIWLTILCLYTLVISYYDTIESITDPITYSDVSDTTSVQFVSIKAIQVYPKFPEFAEYIGYNVLRKYKYSNWQLSR